MTQPWKDTPQQAVILRRHRVAKKVRKDYPYGTRVVATPDGGKTFGQEGTVYRHVPNSNAQGGYLTVDWDNGVRGRISPIAVRRVDR